MRGTLVVLAVLATACGSSSEKKTPGNDAGTSPFDGEPGTLWSLNDHGDQKPTLVAVDTKDGHVVQKVELAGYAGDIHYGDGAVWWFEGTAGVIRIDAVTATASPGVGPRGKQQGAFGAGAAWYLTESGGADHVDLIRIDAATNQVTTLARDMFEIPTGNRQIVAANEEGAFFLEYFGASGEPRLIHVDPLATTDLGFFSLAPYLSDSFDLVHAHCAAQGKTAYVLMTTQVQSAPHKLVSIDTATHALKVAKDMTIDGWSDPDDRLVPTADALYVEDNYNVQLHKLNLETLEIEKTFDLRPPEGTQPILLPSSRGLTVAAGAIWLADNAQLLDRFDLAKGTWSLIVAEKVNGGGARLTFQPP